MFVHRWAPFLLKAIFIFLAGLSFRSKFESVIAPSLSSQPSLNSTEADLAPARVQQIIRTDDSVPWLECPGIQPKRYNHLRANLSNSTITSDGLRKYFFALDLHQAAKKLPSLLGAVVQSIRFLGPEQCVLSVVEGRSTDGTLEILTSLRSEVEEMGALFYLSTSQINPSQHEADDSDRRIDKLASLRNQAIHPLTSSPHLYAKDTSVLFLNDVIPCPSDILELLHQRILQNAHMTCAMDWTYLGENPTFYDIWIARGMTGDTFFHIPDVGGWDDAWNIFWNDEKTTMRFEAHQTFQVFACWNGAAVFTATPLLEQGLRFRAPKEGECYQGEPQLFCKDLWALGYGRIAVVPTVNLEYSLKDARRIKVLKGFVEDWVANEEGVDEEDSVKWEAEPPEMVKCMPDHQHQSWKPWNESLSEGRPGLR